MSAKNRAVRAAFEKCAKEIGSAISRFEKAHGVAITSVHVEHMDDTRNPVVSLVATVDACSGECWK